MVRLSILCALLFNSLIVSAQALTNEVTKGLDAVKEGNIEQGVITIKKTLAAQNIYAQYYMAYCYEHGIVVEKNSSMAFRLYRAAAERGLPDAMYSLSIAYKEGKIAPLNSKKGEEWFSRFNKRGGVRTIPDFAEIYAEGLKAAGGQLYATNDNPEQESTAPATQSIISQLNPKTFGNQNTTSNLSIPKPDAYDKSISDVDMDIPTRTIQSENTFALIIANENYQQASSVKFAHNDGDVFAEYCKNSLGIPERNIHVVKDATLNNIRREVNIFKQIADAYKGEASIIVYYAGHGIPDETTSNSYLLPVDGYVSDVTTCYSLNDFYSSLGQMPATQIVVFLDACFSGSVRGNGMLAAARGVAIKAKQAVPKGKMVVVSASQADETAYPYEEKSHGLFSYFLLKKLKETKGDVCLGELVEYVREHVLKHSVVVNGKSQTPAIMAASLAHEWAEWRLYR